MPTCPKGHTSAATDYCDECGAPIGAAPAPSTSESGAAPASPVEPDLAAPDAASPDAGEPCPECATPRDGRFCEVCGHDFLAEASPAAPKPARPASQAPAAASLAAPKPARPASPAPAAPAPATPASPAPAAPAPATPASPATWRVVVTADRAYYDRMQAAAGADAEPVAFPAYCPERRFELSGREVLVGRRSRSRGIEPGVDLTGPPEDAGVSHAHALFVSTSDGWSVVDLDSANGTYLNDAGDPIAPNQPVPLASGDRVHVGAWTTLTVTAGA